MLARTSRPLGFQVFGDDGVETQAILGAAVGALALRIVAERDGGENFLAAVRAGSAPSTTAEPSNARRVAPGIAGIWVTQAQVTGRAPARAAGGSRSRVSHCPMRCGRTCRVATESLLTVLASRRTGGPLGKH